MVRLISVIFSGICVGMFVLYFWAQPILCDGDVYGQIVPIGGLVTVPVGSNGDLKHVPGKAILFQRTDCKKCISAVLTDKEGKYTAYLGEGKYEMIVRDCGPAKNEDCLPANQRRTLKISGSSDPQFDIQLDYETEGEKPVPKIMVPR